ncbi:MAG: hypothetical protein ABI865_09410, partial [Nitrosospira sp.]
NTITVAVKNENGWSLQYTTDDMNWSEEEGSPIESINPNGNLFRLYLRSGKGFRGSLELEVFSPDPGEAAPGDGPGNQPLVPPMENPDANQVPVSVMR